MNKDFYIKNIEKTASIVGDATSIYRNNRGLINKSLAGLGIAGATGAGAYAMADEDGRKKMRNGVKTVATSIKDGMVNGGAQEAVANAGLVGGALLGSRGGRGLRGAVTGGLAGMATGDILGSAVIPTRQLYKKHKEEFGTAPDKKSVAIALGANVLPTAALWGAVGAGAKFATNPNAPRMVRSLGSIPRNLESSLGRVAENATQAKSSIMNSLDNWRASKARAAEIGMSANEVFKANHGGISRAIGDANRGIAGTGKAMLGTGAAFAPISLLGKGTEIPTYIATPENIVKWKKNRLEGQGENIEQGAES